MQKGKMYEKRKLSQGKRQDKQMRGMEKERVRVRKKKKEREVGKKKITLNIISK